MTALFASRALLPSGLARDVLIEIGGGRFTSVTPDAGPPGPDATRLRGVVLPGFEPTAVLEAIQKYKITATMLVPTMLYMLMDHPKVAEINAARRANAHSELKRWLAGDHTSNNTFR